MTGWAAYRTPSAAHRQLGLVCLGVGTYQADRVNRRSRTLGNYAVVLLSAGHGELVVEARRHPLRAPALFWLRPGQRHSYRSDGPGWVEQWVLFDGGAAAGYAALGYLDGAQPVTTLDDVTPVRHRLADLQRICQGSGPDTDVQAAVGVHLLLGAIRQCRADRDPSGLPALAQLQQDALLPLTVAEHARRLGRSVSELRAMVRTLTGLDVKQHLLQIKLTRAKQLLAETDQPVRDIAREIGYSDAAYFSRLFSRRVGVSPIRFRDQAGPVLKCPDP